MKAKRFISALLALVMVLAMAAPAFAEGEEGTEPETTPEVVIGETAEPEVESETEDEEPEYGIGIGASPIYEGGITSTEPSGKAKAGQLVIVNVEVRDGYTVASLTAKGYKSGNIINCDPIIQDVKYSFTMPAESVGVDISFRSTSAQTYQITYVSNPTEGGTCVGPHKAASGETVTVNVTPNEGYVIKEVAYTKEGDNTHYVLDVDNGVAHFTMPNTEVTVTATFEEEAPAPEQYTIELEYDPEIVEAYLGDPWGINGYAEAGEEVSFQYIVQSGYQIAAVMVVPKDEGSTAEPFEATWDGNSRYHFTMPAYNVVVRINTEPIPAETYKVIIRDTVVNGTIVATPAEDLAEGDTVTLELIPDEGYAYVFNTLLVEDEDGNEIEVPVKYSFTMPASDVYVYAQFGEPEPELYTIELEYDPEIVEAYLGDPWGINGYAEAGEEVSFQYIVQSGYQIAAVMVEPKDEGSTAEPFEATWDGNSRYHFTMPAYNVVVRILTESVEPEPEAPFFSGHSVIISGQIGLEFVVTFPSGGGPGAYPGSYMSFAGHNIDAIDNNPKPTVKGAAVSYFYTVHLSSIQMAEKVTPTFHYFVGEEEITLTDEAYSIEDYLAWALDNVTTERHLRVARALADYGYYGQKYLSTAQNWTIGTDYAEQTLKYSDSFNHDAVYAELASYEVEPHIDGLRVRPIFSSLTSMEIRFNLAEGEEVYLDGNLVEPHMIGEGDYKVTTEGIKASQLTQSHTIKVGDKTDDVTLMWYARIMLGRDNPVMKDFMCAFYNYGAACGAFNN